MMKKIILALIPLCFAVSCNDFVDVVPKGNTIPETVDDLDKLMNLGVMSSTSYTFTEISYNVDYFALYCDDYTLPTDPGHPYYSYNSITIIANLMKWSDPEENSDNKWNGLYRSNYIANYVLDNIDLVKDGMTAKRSEVKGRALVHRALNYFILVNLYGKQYDASAASTSATDLGVPLVLEADINKQYPRATVAIVYEQILTDLTEAISVMEVITPECSNIPSLPAAYALRARVYLWMQNYDEAYNDAVSALALNGKLIDYNDCAQVNPAYGPAAGITGYPTPAAINPEVMLARYKTSSISMLYTDKMLAITDTENDLRHTLFAYYMGEYLLLYYGFHNHSGINTSEVWLTKAEAALRKTSPNIPEAVAALDHVRERRIKTTAYTPTTENDPAALLTEILNERRREIRLTEMSFFDRKRLNVNPTTSRSMTRTFLGAEYTLAVGDLRYQLPIPTDVMQFNSQMIQNER